MLPKRSLTACNDSVAQCLTRTPGVARYWAAPGSRPAPADKCNARTRHITPLTLAEGLRLRLATIQPPVNRSVH